MAAFNVDGHTLHSLLSLPNKADYKDLEGERLQQMQQSLANMKYLIIDERSMVRRKIFGQVYKRLRQVFPQRADEVFGGCSCMLFGDFSQLPPVMDLPLYTTVSRTPLFDVWKAAYQLFNHAVILDQVMRQAGQKPNQVLFRDILLRLRDAQVTTADWQHLMKQTAAQMQDLVPFTTALHLHPTVEAVVEHNVTKPHANGQPIATIKAVHTGPTAAKASPDDTAGLEPAICIAYGARVMLTANLWVDVGLGNGAMGTVVAISTAMEVYPICQLPSWYVLTATLGPPSPTALFPSPHPPHLVCIRCQLLTPAAPPETGLGSYHLQGTRPHTGQSGS